MSVMYPSIVYVSTAGEIRYILAIRSVALHHIDPGALHRETKVRMCVQKLHSHSTHRGNGYSLPVFPPTMIPSRVYCTSRPECLISHETHLRYHGYLKHFHSKKHLSPILGIVFFFCCDKKSVHKLNRTKSHHHTHSLG